MSDIKKFIANILLAGAAGALVAFAVSLFLPKYWLVGGKIVVFPSGKPVSASQNLSAEVGNTAWIVNSDTFQERNFGDFSADFSGAEVVKNSSMVLVKFRSAESDVQAAEDLIVKIPGQVNEYARDLYEGSPFKYKMAGDPEISARPVRPNVRGNVSWGFAIGAALYLLFWLIIEDYFSKKPETEEIFALGKSLPGDFLPEKKEKKEAFEEKIEFEKPAVAEEEPEIIEREAEMEEKKYRAALAKSAAAPSNLPIAEAEISSVPTPSGYHEPSDEEVKDRLNKLMRGEL